MVDSPGEYKIKSAKKLIHGLLTLQGNWEPGQVQDRD